MDTVYELSTVDRFGGLLLDRKQLAKSNEYYHHIHPTEAADVDDRLSEGRAKTDAKITAGAIAAAIRGAEVPAAKGSPKPAAEEPAAKAAAATGNSEPLTGAGN
jgi:NADH-quinone oxidoreductase subunit I